MHLYSAPQYLQVTFWTAVFQIWKYTVELKLFPHSSLLNNSAASLNLASLLRLSMRQTGRGNIFLDRFAVSMIEPLFHAWDICWYQDLFVWLILESWRQIHYILEHLLVYLSASIPALTCKAFLKKQKLFNLFKEYKIILLKKSLQNSINSQYTANTDKQIVCVRVP